MAKLSTPEQRKAVVRKLYEDCLNTGQLEFLDQVIAPDYVGVADQRGPAGFAAPIRALRQGFPDIRWTVEDLLAEGDKVTIRTSWQGTHTSTFRGIPASGKAVIDHAVAIYQFRDDHIVQTWIQTDRLGMLQQIGVVPQDLGVAPLPQE